ncbi:hypothetical protein BHF71_03185 [Vulcanibacillus modesticaldus]|uniref:M23ase beta-sheet core domain-containing protein n=1 Tax=Vulcanibacillus modesticaldus TaxID=337097 RepID=A0A1D2YSU1_9BACI|nr:M23 family metallopeptidase [Vulcanibacillus modesticaldus]OEF98039.1 hypothetical protein BHF71_03185 [Vulcanibacillus modesticaldus]
MGYNSEIQKRRKKRISELYNKKGLSFQHNRRPEYLPSSELGFNYGSRFLIRAIISIFLVLAVYVVFQINQPNAINTQNFIKESLTREYNFRGLYNWYHQIFVGNPAIIPTFKKKVRKINYEFQSPFSIAPTKITRSEQGIYIDVKDKQPVLAIGKGIVINVGKNRKLGNIVMIRHKNGVESIYALLDKVAIEKNEWVESGQLLGTVKQRMFLAIKSNNSYLNPQDVISFE